MRIALDAMGGDFAPKATVEGAVLAARELQLGVVLVGDRATVQKELSAHDVAGLDISIEHAPEAVTMDDSPLESIVGKPNSSIHLCYDLIKAGAVGAAVSAGNSGAMWMSGVVILGNLPGVDRPAIATVLPTSNGLALLIDAGANTDVKPFNLVQFAVMGSAYLHHVRGVSRPRVGVLSNGEEESKGTELTRAAAATLSHMSAYLNYIGYVEGRDINGGKVDVIVTDGFTGNVTLKTMEGFARFMLGNVRELFASSLRGRLAYLLIRKRLTAMRQLLDPSEYGGAPLLGVNGVAIIAHGSSNPQAIRNAIRAAADESRHRQMNREIIDLLAKIPLELPSKSGVKGFRAILNRMRERLHRKPKEGEHEGFPEAPSPGHPAAAPSSRADRSIAKVEGVNAAPGLNGTANTGDNSAHEAASEPDTESPAESAPPPDPAKEPR